MTEQTQPTDAEILALNAGEIHFSESPTKYPEYGHGTQYHAGALGVLSFARAVLAKWGTPAGAGEVAGRVYSANCEYATVQWLKQTSDVGGGDPKNSRSWPIAGDAVYLAPQPTQAQAGAVPLTDEWIRSKCKEPWIFETAKQWIRIAEAAHGIKGDTQ